MINQNDFDAKSYAIRVMKSKGYDVEASDEQYDIFELQWPGWRDLLAKHRIGEDLSKAEQILTAFMQREVIGGATRILEAFAKHLEAQPKQGGSPDWIAASREIAECATCDGRGVVSNIPVIVERRGEMVERIYSFACNCDRGRRFPTMRIAEDWMINLARDRKKNEIEQVNENISRFGVDPNANLETQRKQFRESFRRMREDVTLGKQAAKEVAPRKVKVDPQTQARVMAEVKPRGTVDPRKVEEARDLIANRYRKPEPPPQLDPERVALPVFANGDERNEWA